MTITEIIIIHLLCVDRIYSKPSYSRVFSRYDFQVKLTDSPQ